MCHGMGVTPLRIRSQIPPLSGARLMQDRRVGTGNWSERDGPAREVLGPS